MNGVFNDFRHALRLHSRTPGQTAAAIVVLGLAVAAFAAILSLYVDQSGAHPGFAGGGRQATLGVTDGTIVNDLSYDLVERLASEMASVEAAAMSSGTFVLTGSDRESVGVEMLSKSFFDGWKPELALGRGFVLEDHAPDAEPVVLISYRYWQERLQGDRGVLGRTVEISRNPRFVYRPGSEQDETQTEEQVHFRIVGVMSRRLPGLVFSDTPFWLPLERTYSLFVGAREHLPTATGRTFVRLHEGVSTTAVESEFSTRYVQGTSSEFPNAKPIVVGGMFRDLIGRRIVQAQLNVLLACSVLLALVAAANLSLFLLARAPGRRRELAIRMAVGAPFKRIARQLIAESTLMVSASSVLGLSISAWLSTYVGGLPFMRRAEWHNVTLFDWRVLALSVMFLLLLISLVSLAPIVGVRKSGIGAASRVVSARASPAQRLAGSTQIAVAGLFGGAAIAFSWHLITITLGHPGYETANRYAVYSPTPVNTFLLSRDESLIEFSRRREVIEAIPGVSSVAFGYPLPADQSTSVGPVQVPAIDIAESQIQVFTGIIEREFHDLLGFTLLHGRVPEAGESDDVAVVNRTMARVFWGRENVLRERLPGHDRWGSDGAEIVGIIEDVAFGHPNAANVPYVFSPLGSRGVALTLVEAELSAAELQQALDRAASDGTLEFRVSGVRPLEALRKELIAEDLARGFFSIGAAAIVVVVAAFGFYGLQRYLVSAGRREYAIRASVGAGPRRLQRLVFGRGILQCVPGLIVGGLLAYLAAAWLTGAYVLEDVSAPIVGTLLTCALITLLLVATAGPARDAGRTPPAPLLRED